MCCFLVGLAIYKPNENFGDHSNPGNLDFFTLLKDLSVLKCRWGRNPMIKWNIDFVMGKNLKLWPIPVILVLGRLRQDELRVGLQSEIP